MASVTQEQKRLFFCFSRAHVFQTILSTDVKEKAIAALISVLKMVHSAQLLIIDATGKSNRLSSRGSSLTEAHKTEATRTGSAALAARIRNYVQAIVMEV